MSGPDLFLRNQTATRAVLLSFALVGMLTACTATVTSEGFNSSLTSRYLYVASGSCYAGGAAVSAGSATIVKFDIETGKFAGLVADYNTFGNGDQPNSLTHLDAGRLLVLVENASGRRIDLINTDGTGLTTYISNTTALSAVLRHMTLLPDSSLLVTKAGAIEKFSVAKSRVTQGANPFINAPAAPCATSTTAMTSTAVLPSGKIVFTHAAATPNNIVGVIASTGYATAANCNAGQAAPTTVAMPTSAVYDGSSNKVFVAYGSATTASNLIQSYDVNGTTGAISNSTAAFADSSVVLGPTRLAVDGLNGTMYVANGASAFNNIEKFTIGPNGVLTKVGVAPFIGTGVYTRCITSMEVGP